MSVIHYAGIGSRETPFDILKVMTAIADKKRLVGSILRSGGAEGADMAFEAGALDKKEIFRAKDAVPEAFEIAEKHHPAWHRCTSFAKALHARNAMIILGRDLKTPVSAVICWTKDAEGGGGTGQGIRIAQAWNIQVHDLADPKTLHAYTTWLKE